MSNFTQILQQRRVFQQIWITCNIDLTTEDLPHQSLLSSTFKNVGISMFDDKDSAGNVLATIEDDNGIITNASQLRT